MPKTKESLRPANCPTSLSLPAIWVWRPRPGVSRSTVAVTDVEHIITSSPPSQAVPCPRTTYSATQVGFLSCPHLLFPNVHPDRRALRRLPVSLPPPRHRPLQERWPAGSSRRGAHHARRVCMSDSHSAPRVCRRCRTGDVMLAAHAALGIAVTASLSLSGPDPSDAWPA